MVGEGGEWLFECSKSGVVEEGGMKVVAALMALRVDVSTWT
jgi:hypothetical protein